MRCTRASWRNIIILVNGGRRPLGGRMIPDIADHEAARTRKRGSIISLKVGIRSESSIFLLCAWADLSSDDLPVIRENLRKGFLETQTKVNSWMTNLKKRIDGEEVEEEPQSSQQYEQQHSSYGRPRRSSEMGRRSGDRERYDADPQVLGDDFSALELRDSEGKFQMRLISDAFANYISAPPPRPPRPNIKTGSSPSPDRRKVSFQEGPPTEIDNLYDASASTKRPPSTGGKPSKWQPLANVEPSPVAENDPFSLGDSDDEKEKESKSKEQTTTGEHEQIKTATEEAMSGEMGSKDDKEDASK